MTPIHFAAISCLHAPFGNYRSIGWCLDTLANLKPRPRKLFYLGDLFNADSASVHADTTAHSLESEYEDGATFFAGLREAIPYRCEYIWLRGNHEDNILRADARRVDPRHHSLLHWNKSPFADEFRRWKQLPYIKSSNGCYQLGQVILTHGFDVGVNSDELESLQFVHILGGFSHRLCVRGHTHSPVGVTRATRTRTVPLDNWYCNVGTLGPTQPHYMTRKAAFRWGPAICYGDAVTRPNYNRGKQWNATILTPDGELS